MAQNQAFYQTPTTPSTPSFSDSKPNDDNEAPEIWSASGASNPAAFSGPEAIPWPSQYAQGLGLDHVPTPTQSSFGTSYPVTSPYPPNSAWAPNPVSLAPSCVYPELTAQGTSMDFCYSMATPTMPSSASWDTPAPTSSIFPPTYEGSPGRSDYSESSQQSFVESSPYAHSDDFLQTSDSPFIKVEEQSEYIRPRLYSVPGLMSEQPSHVNPGDIYASPPLSAFDHSNSPYHVSPKVEEEEDVKHFVRHQRQQRPHNRRAFSDDTIEVVEDRQKRGYTTHANSTCHCDQCGKLFQRSYNLKAHMETHDPHRDQPHCCPHPGCKRRFVRRTDLTRHEQSVSIPFVAQESCASLTTIRFT